MRLPWLSGACVALAAPSAAADGGVVPSLVVRGACPSQEAVQGVLASLLTASDPAVMRAAATVVDRGDRFAVGVNGRTKTYPDADRNCAQRARIAAAFIALVLGPEPLTERSEPAAPPEPAPAAPREERKPAARPSPSTSWLRLGVRGALQVSSPMGLTEPGVALDVAGGRGFLGAEASCAWIAAAEIPLGGGAGVTLGRVPCALGPVARLVATPVEGDLKVGLAVGALWTDGHGFSTKFGATRLEAGARLGLDASLRLSQDARVVPTLGLELTYYPVPYDLVVTPRGAVATTPSVWAGATAGVRFGF